MNDWKKYTLVAVIGMAAGFAYIRSSHRNIPSDLRDAVADGASDEFNTLQGTKALDIKPVDGVTVPGTGKGYAERETYEIYGSSAHYGLHIAVPVKWVPISGGEFKMGAPDLSDSSLKDAKPVHTVAIEAFEMSKTAVTVEQYEICVIAGQCTEPHTGGNCNWGAADRRFHPVNCVHWDQAKKYARFISNLRGYSGARLPSESEWEYAAKSEGKDQSYPWGDDKPTCDKAVMDYGCGKHGTMPVCSKTAGNTAQGLCDMTGNVSQWVQDNYRDSYEGLPANGSAFEGAGSGVPVCNSCVYKELDLDRCVKCSKSAGRRSGDRAFECFVCGRKFEGTGSRRVLRGGSFASILANSLRVNTRKNYNPGLHEATIGFRLARSSR